MFKNLRNKFALTIITVSTTIIVLSFSLIFVITTDSIHKNRPLPPEGPNYTTEVKEIVDKHVFEDREKIVNTLLINLIVTGLALELIISFFAFLLAEKYIAPVRQAYESQKTFIANASHEIKTPLAAIEANLEAANIKNNHWIENIEYEVKKNSSLNSELLILAKNDLITEKQTAEEVNLKKLIGDSLNKATPRLDNKNLNFKGKKAIVKIQRNDLLQIFEIFLDNAIKYSNKKISVISTEKYIEIINDGQTIEEKELDKIFNRFYQIDKSSDGVGLGLSIASSIAKRNKWKIIPKSTDKTTSFKLIFKS